jgi:hypothetical protein
LYKSAGGRGPSLALAAPLDIASRSIAVDSRNSCNFIVASFKTDAAQQKLQLLFNSDSGLRCSKKA